jgi:dienelactone hydrolase
MLASTAALAGEAVVYDVDGAPYEGYFAPASGDSKGLVLIVHDWDGLDSYETGRADMLAELGYDAFALDLFGQGNRPETVEARREATGALYQDRAAMRARLMGGLEAARGQSDQDTVVMGYCFGGAAVLEMARSGAADRVTGYATFHGGLSTPDGQSYPAETPPLLIAHGGADSSITMADVAALSEELEAAGITYEIEVYSGAPHAFTVRGSDRYQERADTKSWDAFTEFLDTTLGS